MRKTCIVLLAALLLFGCSGQATKYTDGTYTETSAGHNGSIEVETVVEDGKIKSVRILSHSETPGVSDPAIKRIPEEIVANNTYEVDAIAGATVTSEAIKTAVEAALK